MTTIVTVQSGLPLAVTQGTNFNAFAGFGIQRPTLTGIDPTLPAGQRTIAEWFNVDAFKVTPQFSIGTSSRNPVRGPGYRDVDLALIRRIALERRFGLEVRIEVFNLLNTPPLGAPNVVVGTAASDPSILPVIAGDSARLKLLF